MITLCGYRTSSLGVRVGVQDWRRGRLGQAFFELQTMKAIWRPWARARTAETSNRRLSWATERGGTRRSNDGTVVSGHGTPVPFSKESVRRNLLIEQFWGRAARGPRDSKELRGSRIFCGQQRDVEKIRFVF